MKHKKEKKMLKIILRLNLQFPVFIFNPKYADNNLLFVMWKEFSRLIFEVMLYRNKIDYIVYEMVSVYYYILPTSIAPYWPFIYFIRKIYIYTIYIYRINAQYQKWKLETKGKKY